MYLYTFLSLFDPFVLVLILDKSLFLHCPGVRTLLIFRLNLYSNIHRLCFFTFKISIKFLFYAVNTSLYIPYAHLWYYQLVISLSNDISENPGPIQADHNRAESSHFSFCNWNLNTLSKGDFSRLTLLHAHNLDYKYDLISLCETSLGTNETVPLNIIPGYLYHPCNHPSGEKKGGVGILYRDDLPIIIRNDLSFDECIVVELRFGNKKVFFTVIYRNPIHKADSPIF